MSQLATESEPPPEVDAPPGFWQRWYWPVITIAALVAFELTASPTLSALLLCCHFGSEDWLTGVWLWRNDPHLGRGRACAWFSFARAVTRTLLAAFALLLLLLWVMALFAKQPFRGPPGGLVAVQILMAVGLPLATLLSLVACLSARRHSVKVWLDPGLYASRRHGQWPVSLAGGRNLAVMPCQVTVAVLLSLLMVIVLVLITALDPRQRLAPGFSFPLWIGVLLGIVTTLWFILRSESHVRARAPHDCWEHAPLPPENLIPAPGPSDHPEEGAEIPVDPVDPLD
jgi:hypothetical protein